MHNFQNYLTLQRIKLNNLKTYISWNIARAAFIIIASQSAVSNANGEIHSAADSFWTGTNLSGAEFGSIDGKFGFDYIYPSASNLDFVAKAGMTVVRLPVRWERLQPTLTGPLDAPELGRLMEFIGHAGRRNITVIVDIHNYARYHGDLIGSAAVPTSAFEDLWTKLAVQFADNQNVALGLMNEPHGIDASTWVKFANSAIDAIRRTGARNLILAPGVAWTGAHSWDAAWYGTPNGVAMVELSDPLKNTVIEVHQYLDSDSSGTSSDCVSETVGKDRIIAFTHWARKHNRRAFLGEFGSGINTMCRTAVSTMLSYIALNKDVWMGWSWWSAGPWWGDYPFSIQPYANGSPKPQMNWLVPFVTQSIDR